MTFFYFSFTPRSLLVLCGLCKGICSGVDADDALSRVLVLAVDGEVNARIRIAHVSEM